jgi:hypothetical protein
MPLLRLAALTYRFPMRRGGTWLALTGAVLALAACGGNGGDAAPDEPGLPSGLAERLAKESEAVADKLDAGDQCGAAEQADVVEDAVEQAIAEGNVPDPFQAELTAAAKKLQNDVNCPQQPPPAPEVDCEGLEEQKHALEEQKEDAEEDEMKELDQQLKDLDRQLKACGKGNEGDGEGDE